MIGNSMLASHIGEPRAKAQRSLENKLNIKKKILSTNLQKWGPNIFL